jgi:hypothetical protein
MKHKNALKLQFHNKKTHWVWHKKYSPYRCKLEKNFNVDSRCLEVSIPQQKHILGLAQEIFPLLVQA